MSAVAVTSGIAKVVPGACRAETPSPDEVSANWSGTLVVGAEARNSRTSAWKHTVASVQRPVDGKFGEGRISKPLFEFSNTKRMPFTAAVATPVGIDGVELDVRVPTTQVPRAHAATDVHTSTRTRLAPFGKFTAIEPAKVTASKKSASTSVMINCFRYRVPVFWARCFTVTICGARPGLGRTTVGGTIDLLRLAPEPGTPLVTVDGRQNGDAVFGSSMPTAAQLRNDVPTGWPSRRRTV